MNPVESKYIEKKGYLSRYSHERTVALREGEALAAGQALRQITSNPAGTTCDQNYFSHL